MVGADCRVLILGSLPGVQSLAARQYYAHPRNRFWELVGAAIARPDLPALPYEARIAALKDRGIGLWDVFASARRTGSLDSAIRDAAHADLPGLIDAIPLLRAVAFNGKAASRASRRVLDRVELPLLDLPSSSPANASIPLAAKRSAWLDLRRFLD
ncbi:DNA-deoxyinosine glycosylase [Novosphingobium aquiterrae]|uniref:DNA-deoxyinosine glycosylase n=1 Tax=Novosphingobium aquiterrae TaxID=624388 RepID=A0ABV6PEU1_9SPHN